MKFFKEAHSGFKEFQDCVATPALSLLGIFLLQGLWWTIPVWVGRLRNPQLICSLGWKAAIIHGVLLLHLLGFMK